MIVTPHLQAYYRFENNGLDSSGKGNHLTAVGATYGAGKVGNGTIYDGVDDYHNGGNILNLGLDSWFISLWVKPTATTGIRNILSKLKVGEFPLRYGIYYETGNIKALININTEISIPATNTPVNQWTNIMLNIDRLGLMTMYINLISKGSINISSLSTTNFSTSYPFTLANFLLGIPVYTPYAGQIDEVLMYNKTMSETDRKRIFCNMHPLNG